MTQKGLQYQLFNFFITHFMKAICHFIQDEGKLQLHCDADQVKAISHRPSGQSANSTIHLIHLGQ